MKRILESDPLTGKTIYHDYDPLTDTTILETVYDVEPVLEHNKALQNHEVNGWKGNDSEFWYAGEIPLGLVLKWLVEEGIDVFDPDDWPAVKRKLNSNEFRHLRTGLFNL